jgi:multisubunit Na+/H+ antiporter MnhF subunit
MNVWEVCAAILAAALLPPVAVCLFAGAAAALAALEVAGTVSASALMILSETFHRQPFVDLALILAILTVVGGLVFARVMEDL